MELKKGQVSKEVLFHFQCLDCVKWWSIGDADENKTDWLCPWCGEQQEFDLE